MRLSLFLILTFAVNVFATEVDSFSQRHIELVDSTSELNRLVNQWMSEVDLAQTDCNKDKLIRAIANKFTRFGWSKFETRVVGDNTIPQFYPIEDHVYSEFNTTLQLPYTISTLMRVRDVWIGADKFSHFFNEGHNYYKRLSRFNGNMNKVLEYGHNMEAGMWGIRSTGVYSYADLVANFEGLSFFQSLVEGETPYYSCIQNKWTQVREFDWIEYVNHGWDEGMNCNRFLSDELKNLHDEKISHLENRYQLNLTCPIEPAYCEDLKAKYRFHADHLLSGECRMATH